MRVSNSVSSIRDYVAGLINVVSKSIDVQMLSFILIIIRTIIFNNSIMYKSANSMYLSKNTSHHEKCFSMRPEGRFFIALNQEGGSDVFHRRQKTGI